MDYLMQMKEGGTSQIHPGRVDDLILEGFQDILSRGLVSEGVDTPRCL
jgi:hypothetical protein